MSIFILDFNDSFTRNIGRFFYAKGFKIEFISFPHNINNLQKAIDNYFLKKRGVVVWGPGPGHPNQFKNYDSIIEMTINSEKIFNMGICLGHQLLGQYFGYSLDYLSTPMHGICREIVFRAKRPFSYWENKSRIQNYNSIFIPFEASIKTRVPIQKILVIENRIEALFWKRGMSYQFHPESVGTSCPEQYFKPALDFLYND